jgi:hypothetical protein
MAGTELIAPGGAGSVLVRVEDYLLGAWMAVAGPLVTRAQRPAGLFEPARPLDGLFELLAVFAAVACIATRSSDRPPGAGTGILGRGAVGPLTGGLMLVALDGGTALGLGGSAVPGGIVVAAVMVIAIRRWRPELPTAARRLLVTPFVLAAGGIYWMVIGAVTGTAASPGGAPTGSSPFLGAIGDPGSTAVALGALVAFSSIYYAMLIFAPRQVAEPEGGPLSWVARYGIFLAGVLLGFTWLSVLGT